MLTYSTPIPAASEPDFSPPDDQVFDHAAALDRLDGDQAFLCELAELFMQDAPQRLASLATGLAEHALPDVEALAHNLKGSACHFVPARTVATAQCLESAAAEGDFIAASEAYPNLLAEIDRLLASLHAMLVQHVA